MDKDLEVANLAKWLKSAREAAGFSREFAAGALGVTYKTVERWELGKHPPSGDTLIRAAALYHVPLTELPGATNVLRGTALGVGERTPLTYRHMVQFEALSRELIRAGASDREADFLLDVLKRPETGRLIEVGRDGSALSDQAVDEQWDALLDDFRALIKRRIARRTGQSVIDSGEIERAGLAGLRPPTAEERSRPDSSGAESPRPAARKPGKRAGRGR